MIRFEIDVDLFGMAAARQNLVTVDPQASSPWRFSRRSQKLELKLRPPSVEQTRRARDKAILGVRPQNIGV